MESLRDVNFQSMIFRLILAMIGGGILGVERGIKNRPAGLRTYMLVSLGSMLVMVTNLYLTELYSVTDVDPTRMGAQVVSGIGFLGAGTIIVTSRNQIRGITTAASLWVAACIGLVIGAGFYEAAILGMVATLIILIMMNRIDDFLKDRAKEVSLYIEFNKIANIQKLVEDLQGFGLSIKDMSMDTAIIPGEDKIALILTVESDRKINQLQVIQMIHREEGIVYVERLD